MFEKNIVTYTQNIFLPISNICRNKCAYCGFHGSPNNGGWLMQPSEVRLLAELGKREGCVEALITTGEKPETYPEVNKFLKKLGHPDFTHYVAAL